MVSCNVLQYNALQCDVMQFNVMQRDARSRPVTSHNAMSRSPCVATRRYIRTSFAPHLAQFTPRAFLTQSPTSPLPHPHSEKTLVRMGITTSMISAVTELCKSEAGGTIDFAEFKEFMMTRPKLVLGMFPCVLSLIAKDIAQQNGISLDPGPTSPTSSTSSRGPLKLPQNVTPPPRSPVDTSNDVVFQNQGRSSRRKERNA